MPSLEDLVKEVRREHDAVLTAGAQVIQHAILAGEALLAVKATLPRGEFDDWVLTEEYSVGTVRQYMRIARYRNIIELNQPPTLRDALILLHGAPASNTPPPHLVAEVRRLRDEEGWSFNAIAEEMEISKSNIHRWYKGEVRSGPSGRHRRTLADRREDNRKAREAAAKAAGTSWFTGYSGMLELRATFERIRDEANDREVKKIASSFAGRLRWLEDELARALKIINERNDS